MLEQPCLLLRPWLPVDQVSWPLPPSVCSNRIRMVLDPTNDQPLGCALWHGPAGGGWLAGLTGKKIQVFESEDISLLLALRRSWGLFRTWQVRDAEDNHLGQISPGNLRDSLGGPLASLQGRQGGEYSWVSPAGFELGTWHELPGHDLVFRFGEATDKNPFLRMVTLAGLLVLPPWPNPT